ncbi:vpu [Simian immunodeficiency virus]|uniref:Protein Vpu n=2 Tax=Simian immunodeficiency virus TaxID=11723 RepID=VPU_SIVTN|nr:RecName: Full=Protein Vpu; AltName: Full=U ORF protein; AltName: Full=Viral protein U [SIVcpz TAN1]AAO13965.1 vpu [Simian immunodeficiency virus]ABQ51065.1 vpu protein [Simian immunodeficiency virus]
MIKIVVGSVSTNVIGILCILLILIGGGLLIGIGIRRELERERQHQRVLERLARRLSIDSGVEEDEEFNWNNFDPHNYNPRDWI